jgi:hypothetical protein
LRRSAAINSNIFVISSSSSSGVINQTTTCLRSRGSLWLLCTYRTPIWYPISLTTHEQLLYKKNQNCIDKKNRKLHRRNTTPFLVLAPAI